MRIPGADRHLVARHELGIHWDAVLIGTPQRPHCTGIASGTPGNVAKLSNGTIQYDHLAAAESDYRDTKFTFDSQGRQLSRTLPLGASPVAALPAGTDVRTLAGVAGAFTEGFCYNDRGQKTPHFSFEGVVTSYAYDMGLGGGRLTEERFFDSVTQYNNGTGTPSEIWTHTYDALGREVQVVQAGDGNLATTSDQRVTATAYDAANTAHHYMTSICNAISTVWVSALIMVTRQRPTSAGGSCVDVRGQAVRDNFGEHQTKICTCCRWKDGH